MLPVIIGSLIGLSGIVVAVYLSKNKKPVSTQIDVSEHAVVVEARSKAKELIFEAKESAQKLKEESLNLERDLTVKKAELDSKDADLQNRASTLKLAKEKLDLKQDEVDKLFKKQQTQLEEVASLSKEEGKKLLLENLDRDLREEKSKRIRQIEEELKKKATDLSKEIVLDAMRYDARDIVIEYTTSKVPLADPEMKGRIIGKEGRNIKRFEELTGVSLDLDADNGMVIVSCFDPVRREIGRVALERLLTDGRIQPARIEEVIEKTQQEVDKIIYKAGDDLCHKLGAYNVPKELIAYLGKFKYRFSYGQNMLAHTLEVARIGMSIAHELKADVDIVKHGCLYHDIGKIIADEDGSHVTLGVELLNKYKVDPKVVACVAEHHDDSQSSFESAIVALADQISGARPGSRNEDYSAYVKRLQDLEAAAMSFDGVEKVYAVSAGREVRVFVSPDRVDDTSTELLAREIAKKIELEQTYPGVVKVIVIREKRATETAK